MMENPKYAGLPGIAPPEEKDVYETDDLPEADQDPEFSEVESENIERPHLDISSAHSRFKGKTLICGKDVDFSDKYRKKRHTGYQAVSGEWDIAGEGEEETIVQRYNRLQCEWKLLLEDINELKECNNEEKRKEWAKVEPLLPQLQQSMQQINSCLNFSSAFGEDFMKFLADPQEAQVGSLLSKLDQLKEVANTSKKSEESDQISNNAVVTYRLQTLPAQNKFVQTARLANLEQRVNKLEAVIGTASENLNRLALSEFKNVTQATREISARVNLLDATQVEKMEKKLESVLSKMDSLAEKRGGPETIERLKKIDELYDRLAKASDLNDSLQFLMERLIALKSLHVEAGEFKKTLKQLETDIGNASVTIGNNEAVLSSIKDSLEKHSSTIRKNIESFDERLKAVKK